MTTTLDRPPTQELPANGGLPACRAVVRWAWRLLRHEWRQQLLVLALIVVAVAATIIGGAVSTDTRQPSNFGFGTAQDSATFQSLSPHVTSQLSSLRHRFGAVEVIENQTFTIPGSINTYQLRAESAAGPFSRPMLSLLSGQDPIGPDEVAVTSGVASAFHLGIGDLWTVDGTTRRVVGMVQNPQSLLDEFALVVPGQVRTPTQVTALFDAHGMPPGAIGPTVETSNSAAPGNVLNPETISLAALVLGMLLIALVSIGGFTVLAQRRLRSIGMLQSLGATDRHVSLVVRANGALVGLVGAVMGFGLSLVVWFAYRPTLEQSAHHTIGIWALPWLVVVLSVVLAIIITTYFAASRPARAITKLSLVAALSGRPAPPRKVRRSAIPGIVLLVVAFLLLGYSGSTNGNGSGAGELLLGLVALIPGLILLAPFLLSLVARVAGRAPIAPRLALRDLARYRARSGSALSAISIGVLIAVIVSLAAAARYGNVLDYAGPNLESNQLALQANTPPPAGAIIIDNGRRSVAPAPSTPVPNPAMLAQSAQHIAADLGVKSIALESPDAQVNHVGSGRDWDGQIYVATPRLLKAFGIKESQIQPDADFLTSRPGLSGVTGLYLTYGGTGKVLGGKGGGGDPANGPGPGNEPGPGPEGSLSVCSAATDCLADPIFQEMSTLPTGTSAPNTVITEHAMHQFHLRASTSDWLVQRAEPFTAAQISRAQLTASTAQLSVESKNDQPSSSQIINWATALGIILALGILAMSIGLIRSETANDLRTLTAVGASSSTRRTLTAVTAGALGFLGALLGTLGGYLALIGWLRSNSLNGGISSLGNVPITNLLIILVGMPLVATIVGWLSAGHQPSGVARQPMD